MSKLPRVVLVGRMNVGKSTLFNRLSNQVKSITLDYEGVTRDFIKETIEWNKKTFELIDTGGVSLRKTQDALLQEVRERAMQQLDAATIVLFVLDGKVGLLPEDREIAKLLHQKGKAVIAVVNKTDASVSQVHAHEFDRMGFNVIHISAQHGSGIADLLSAIVDGIGKQPAIVAEAEPRYRVVLLGKPNVGKSSLMNLLVKQERSIVSDVAGTTREAIAEHVTFYQEDLEVIDTPGLRRQRSIKDHIEDLMVRSSLRSVDKSDIVLLLVDGSEGMFADQELKLAFYTFKEKYKALIVLINKSDLMDEQSTDELKHETELYKFLFDKIATMRISCKDGKNVGKVFPLVNEVWKRHSQKFSDEELTVLFKSELTKRPLFHKTQPLELYRVQQVATAPITLALRVNMPDWFGESQLGFFENILRKQYNLVGVPVRFLVRKQSKN